MGHNSGLLTESLVVSLVLSWGFAEDADGRSDAGTHSCETLMEAVKADTLPGCVVTERAAGFLSLSRFITLTVPR